MLLYWEAIWGVCLAVGPLCHEVFPISLLEAIAREHMDRYNLLVMCDLHCVF